VRRKVAELVSLVFAPQVYGGAAGVALWFSAGGGFDVPVVLALTLTVLPLLPILVSA